MYRLISTASTTRGNILAVCPPHGFNCRDNQVNAYTGILTYPYTHNKSSLCALHNQYKHLENVTVMIYTKYVVLLTQLCMDGPNILHRGWGIAVLQPCPHYSLPRILILPHDTNSVNSIFIIKRTPTNIVGVLSIFWGTVKNLSPSTLQIIKDLYFWAICLSGFFFIMFLWCGDRHSILYIL